MLVVDLVRVLGGGRVAKVSHDAHACDVVSRIGTKIFWFIIFLNDPIVDSCHCLYKIGQSPSIVRRCLVDKFVIDKRPYSLVLVHV